MWKKGRGKLGFLQPLLGRWQAQADSPMGPLSCTRTLEPVLGGAYIQLTARWLFGDAAKKRDGASNDGYQEIALIGVDSERQVAFWSFTSDGKQSRGVQADVSDLHPEAVGFEAQMPAGLARMACWPEEGGFVWVVEAKNAKGWRRFTEHHYRAAPKAR